MSFDFGEAKTPWQEYVDNQKKISDNKENLKLLKEKDFLQSAKHEGLVNVLKKHDLICNGCDENDRNAQYPTDILFLQLSNKRLQNVTAIEICDRLRICDLSGNFLKSLKSLRNCLNLFCLDVHGNQVNNIMLRNKKNHCECDGDIFEQKAYSL